MKDPEFKHTRRILFGLAGLLMLMTLVSASFVQGWQLPQVGGFRTESGDQVNVVLGKHPDHKTQTPLKQCEERYSHELSRVLHKGSQLQLEVTNHNNSTLSVIVTFEEDLYQIIEEEPLLPKITNHGYFSLGNEAHHLVPATTWVARINQISPVDVGDQSFVKNVQIRVVHTDGVNNPCHIPQNSTAFVSSKITILAEGEGDLSDRIEDIFVLLANRLELVVAFLGSIIFLAIRARKYGREGDISEF